MLQTKRNETKRTELNRIESKPKLRNQNRSSSSQDSTHLKWLAVKPIKQATHAPKIQTPEKTTKPPKAIRSRKPDGHRERTHGAHPTYAAHGKNKKGLCRVSSTEPIKPAITYFPAEQYHWRQGLNFCVRDGNRCDPLSIFTDKS